MDAYWRSLLDQYSKTRDELRPYEQRGSTLIEEDAKTYEQLRQEYWDIVAAMGEEFPELFSEYMKLRNGVNT